MEQYKFSKLKILCPPQRSDAVATLNSLRRSRAVITFALDGTIFDANDNFLGLMGYDRAEVRGRHNRIFVDPTEVERADYETFWQRLRSGALQSAQYRRIAKDGRAVWIRATYNPVLDARGRPVKIVKFAPDVTAEKLVAAETAGQIVAIGCSQTVIQFDLDGTIRSANANFLTALGYGADKVVGCHQSMFVEPAEAPSSEYHAFWAVFGRGELRSGEFRRLGWDGRELRIQATHNPIFDLAGKPFKVVKYASDITQAKRTAPIWRARSRGRAPLDQTDAALAALSAYRDKPTGNIRVNPSMNCKSVADASRKGASAPPRGPGADRRSRDSRRPCADRRAGA